MLTVLKTISWAMVSGVVIFTTLVYETGNSWVSFVAAFFAVTLKIPFYTIHEWIWNKFTGHHKIHLPESTVDDEEEEQAIAA